jgi:hypothetical protein
MTDIGEERKATDDELQTQFGRLVYRCRVNRDAFHGEVGIHLYRFDALAILWAAKRLLETKTVDSGLHGQALLPSDDGIQGQLPD